MTLPVGIHPTTILPTTGIHSERPTAHRAGGIVTPCAIPMWMTDQPLRTAARIEPLHPWWCATCFPLAQLRTAA